MTPAGMERLSESPPRPSARATCAVPRVGWPANGISKLVVKIRTPAAAPPTGGTRKVVSDRLNWRARPCICSSLRLDPSSNTHNGLPVKGSPSLANTLRSR
jgi:hypothetical protein